MQIRLCHQGTTNLQAIQLAHPRVTVRPPVSVTKRSVSTETGAARPLRIPCAAGDSDEIRASHFGMKWDDKRPKALAS